MQVPDPLVITTSSCFSVQNDLYVVSIAAHLAICLVGGKQFPLCNDTHSGMCVYE